MLSQQPSQVDASADQISDALHERGKTLELVLAVLREARDRAFAERYPEAGEAPESTGRE